MASLRGSSILAYPFCLIKRGHPSAGILKPLFLTTFFILSSGRLAVAGDSLRVESIPQVVKQGDACIVRASGPASLPSIHGEFRGGRFPLPAASHPRTYEGLLGIDMDTPPGKYKIKVTAKDGEGRLYKSTLWLKVQKADFSTQKITLPSSMVELDPKTLERVNQEAKRLQVLFQGFRNERLWTSPFLRPVKGEISSAFGMRRIINEKPKSPHTGVDLRAEEGTPVLACNSGIVALVDQLFFSGNSVVLDHGWGIYSMYFHLSEALVREGDGVNKGDLLGRVGSTGRSTAPHLHWGVRINGVMVNPLSLLQLTEHLREGSIIQK